MQKSKETLSELESALGYVFKDRALLQLALTHTSYANEHRREGVGHNERLEFLGDAVLEMVSSEFLFERFPTMKEGDLSKMRASLVCEPTLALCARDFNLMPFIRLGRGEEMNGGRFRDSIVSDAVESVIAAIYLDGGFEPARSFIRQHILNDIDRKKTFVDSKSRLQEMVQADGRSCQYKLISETGPDHDKWFKVEVLIDGRPVAEGEGHTKKQAEQQAADNAINLKES
ncbi:MAG: ribonuclease III [Lachnospiraceae bacterium]|nr:ribonuclease III [Lachnospiraceae bacterium]